MSKTGMTRTHSEIPALAADRKLTLIVPCFNEAESIGKLVHALDRVQAALASEFQLQFVLVDDGSRDATWALLYDQFAMRGNVRLVRHATNRGIAAAIATGLREAQTEMVASMDADCTYDPVQLVAMLPLLSPGVDMVVASPYHPAGQVVGVPAWRLAISKAASRLYRCVMRNALHTYTSCFRVYRRSEVVDLPLQNPGFVGVVELVWQLDRRGRQIAEYPATLTVRTTGQSKLRLARTIAAHLCLLTRAGFDRVLHLPWVLWASHSNYRAVPAPASASSSLKP
jgi:glycosyltransferase involved in cell wall biosynthesis